MVARIESVSSKDIFCPPPHSKNHQRVWQITIKSNFLPIQLKHHWKERKNLEMGKYLNIYNASSQRRISSKKKKSAIWQILTKLLENLNIWFWFMHCIDCYIRLHFSSFTVLIFERKWMLIFSAQVRRRSCMVMQEL